MKRHTILLTVLINAGLLLVLFATAIHRGEGKGKAALAAPEAPTPIVYEPPVRPVREVPPTPLVVEEAIAQAPASVPEGPVPAVERVAMVEPPKLVEVTVKKGDSLDKIARGNGTSIDALMKANGLRTSRLQIGQVLKVPLAEEKPVVSLAKVANDEAYYVVRSGDNPWLIASKHGIPLEKLLAINGLNEQSARKLKPGDKIRIQ